MLPLENLRLSKKLGVLNVDVVYSDSRSKKGIEIAATGRVGTPKRNTRNKILKVTTCITRQTSKRIK